MNLPHERIHPDLGMGVGFDRANRHVRNSTHPTGKHNDPHRNEIDRLGRIRLHCMAMGVGIDPANRHVRNSRYPNIKHIDPHRNEIHRLGRQTVLATGNERSEFPGDFLRGDHSTF
jgi:hypothetical protein